jgi:hypothetical protein
LFDRPKPTAGCSANGRRRKSYKYLGSVVNGDNSFEEEITERIALGSKAHYANPKIFKTKLLSKEGKLK